MILYFAQESKSDPGFGAVKLAKLLFFTDFLAMRHLGQPITKLKYFKLPQGPVPTLAKEIEEGMIKDGSIEQIRLPIGKTVQKRVVAKKEPDLSVFTQDEINLMSNVVKNLRKETATSVSDLSHRFIGWQIARDNEEILPITALIDTTPPTAQMRDFALRAAGIDPDREYLE